MIRMFVLPFAVWLCWCAAGNAQQPEVFLGKRNDLWGDLPGAIGKEPSENHLAKCLANPDDRLSCYMASMEIKERGLESAVTDELEVVTYVLCDEKNGVCQKRRKPYAGLPSEEPQRVGLSAVDITILFDLDSAIIEPSESGKLKQIATALKAPINEGTRYAIIGHTDETSTERYNCTLSKKRGAAVSDRLLSDGLKADRLIVIGAGEYMLKTTNDGTAPENRRVGFAKLDAEQSSVVEKMKSLCVEDLF